jgi:branched-subunit amino acid transport protein AzlD
MLEVFIASIANFMTRAIPFVMFKKLPKKLVLFELFLPPIILSILLLYIIFYNRTQNDLIYINQLIGILTTIALQLKFKHYLVSIFGGTFVYICLLNYI